MLQHYQPWMLPAAICIAAIVGYFVLYHFQKEHARVSRIMRIGL